MYDIEIYIAKNGRSEVKEYINTLSIKKDKNSRIKYNKIIAYIRMLKINGLTLGEPYIKHVDNEIWELRPLRDRILFANCNNNKFILLSIFMKKTQKTPKKEIDKAKNILEDYKERGNYYE